MAFRTSRRRRPTTAIQHERERIAARYKPSARELFPELRVRLLASRPVLSVIDEGKPTQRVIYGAPTFRNVIENGVHR